MKGFFTEQHSCHDPIHHGIEADPIESSAAAEPVGVNRTFSASSFAWEMTDGIEMIGAPDPDEVAPNLRVDGNDAVAGGFGR